MKIDSTVCKEMIDKVFGKSDWRRLRKFKDVQDRTVREFEDGVHQVVTVISGRDDKEIVLIGKGALADQPAEKAGPVIGSGMGQTHKVVLEWSTYDNDAIERLIGCFNGRSNVKVVMDEDGDNVQDRTFEFDTLTRVEVDEFTKGDPDNDENNIYELTVSGDHRKFICMLICIEQCAGCGHGLGIKTYLDDREDEDMGFDGDGSDCIHEIRLDGKKVKDSYAPMDYESTL